MFFKEQCAKYILSIEQIIFNTYNIIIIIFYVCLNHFQLLHLDYL